MAETGGIQWHVIPQGQRLTTTISPNGMGFDDVWEVTYQIDSGPAKGTQSTVRISASDYSANMVAATIAAQVKHLHDVGSL